MTTIDRSRLDELVSRLDAVAHCLDAVERSSVFQRGYGAPARTRNAVARFSQSLSNETSLELETFRANALEVVKRLDAANVTIRTLGKAGTICVSSEVESARHALHAIRRARDAIVATATNATTRPTHQGHEQ